MKRTILSLLLLTPFGLWAANRPGGGHSGGSALTSRSPRTHGPAGAVGHAGSLPRTSGGTATSQRVGVAELDHMDTHQREELLKKLPEDQRERVEQQLRSYSNLSEPEKKQLYDRYERFKALPPQKQQKIRDAFDHYQKSTPDRQDAIRSELKTLRTLPEDRQKERLKSKDFKEQFSKDERKTIENFLAAPDE